MRVLVLVPVVSRTRAGLPGRIDRKPSMHSPEDRLAEAKGLAEAIDLDVRTALLVPVPQPNPATLFGSGKVEELRALIEELEVGLVIVEEALTHAGSPAERPSPRC